MTNNPDLSTSKLTPHTVDSWNPPFAYGNSAGDIAGDQVDEKGRRTRPVSNQDMNAFLSSTNLLAKSNLSFPSGDQPQRVAFSEWFQANRRNRCTVTTKSPPPVATFMVEGSKSGSSVDATTINLDASLCASSVGSKTVVWSLASQSAKISSDDMSTSKAYQTLFHAADKHRLDLPTGPSTLALDFAPDSPLLLTGSARGDIGLWSVESGQKIVSYTGLTSRTAVWSLSWCPAASYFSTGSSDGSVRVWRSDIPFPVRILDVPESRHSQIVKWHPSCQLLAVGSENSITVHEIASSVISFKFEFPKATAIAFSPTGYLLAAANEDSLTVWELHAGSQLFQCDTFATIVDLSWAHPSASMLGDGGLRSVSMQVGTGHPVLVSVEQSGKLRVWDRLFVSKPSACELELSGPIRPLHMHVTPRNLVVVAGAQDEHPQSVFESLKSFS